MTTLTREEREAVSLLLPWYATGALGTKDRARVERALAADPGLRAELELVREDGAAVRSLAEEEPAPASMAARFDALFAQERARAGRPTPRAPAARGLAERLAAFLAPPHRLAWAGAAAAIVVALQAGAILTLLDSRRPESGFSTASGPDAAGGVAVLVRFVPERTAAEIEAWLAANRARIADGPLPGGLYRLRFQDAVEENATALAGRLSAQGAMFTLVLPAQ